MRDDEQAVPPQVSGIVQMSTGKDLTEAIRAVFDIAYQSMDHGSGFLGTEEIDALLALARAILPSNDSVVRDLEHEQRQMARGHQVLLAAKQGKSR